jgi:hypothetical protein
MMDISKKTAASTSQFDGVSWEKLKQKWVARVGFSNNHVSLNKTLGLFGIKGKKSTGEVEASECVKKVRNHVERINEDVVVEKKINKTLTKVALIYKIA